MTFWILQFRQPEHGLIIELLTFNGNFLATKQKTLCRIADMEIAELDKVELILHNFYFNPVVKFCAGAVFRYQHIHPAPGKNGRAFRINTVIG